MNFGEYTGARGNSTTSYQIVLSMRRAAALYARALKPDVLHRRYDALRRIKPASVPRAELDGGVL
jgi:hypothetical protein